MPSVWDMWELSVSLQFLCKSILQLKSLLKDSKNTKFIGGDMNVIKEFIPCGKNPNEGEYLVRWDYRKERGLWERWKLLQRRKHLI